MKSVRLTGGGEAEPPGFFATMFGALSDIPREQPIRDNLEAIDRMSARIRRLRRITESIRPEVEAAIERAVGSSFFLSSPTPGAARRLARQGQQALRARGRLCLCRLRPAQDRDRGRGDGRRHLPPGRRRRHRAPRGGARGGLGPCPRDRPRRCRTRSPRKGARDDVVAFLIDFDLTFRTRRLRFVARRITETTETMEAPREEQEEVLRILHAAIARYRAREPGSGRRSGAARLRRGRRGSGRGGGGARRDCSAWRRSTARPTRR